MLNQNKLILLHQNSNKLSKKPSMNPTNPTLIDRDSTLRDFNFKGKIQTPQRETA